MSKRYLVDSVLVVLVVLVLTTCSFPQRDQVWSKNDDIDGIVIHVDALEKDRTGLRASKMFNPPQMIILEKKDESIIGQVDDLQVFDGHIYVLDSRQAVALYVFDFDGNFVRKIGTRGRGPGEYARLSDFTIDTQKKEIYIADGVRLHRYTTEGTFLSSVNMEISNANVYAIQFFEDAIYAATTPFSQDDDAYLLSKIDPNNGKRISGFFKSSQYIKSSNWNLNISYESKPFYARIHGVPKFMHILMTSITPLDPMFPPITLNSRHLITEQDINETLRQPEIFSQIEYLSTLQRIFHINTFVESSNFKFFNYGRGNGLYGTLVLNLNDREVFHYSLLINDILWINPAMLMNIRFFDNLGVYEIIDVMMLDMFLKNIDNMALDAEKKDKLRGLNEESNPVIFFYDFKDVVE